MHQMATMVGQYNAFPKLSTGGHELLPILQLIKLIEWQQDNDILTRVFMKHKLSLQRATAEVKKCCTLKVIVNEITPLSEY